MNLLKFDAWCIKQNIYRDSKGYYKMKGAQKNRLETSQVWNDYLQQTQSSHPLNVLP